MNGKNTGKDKNTVYTISSFWAKASVAFTRLLGVPVQSLGRTRLVAAAAKCAPLQCLQCKVPQVCQSMNKSVCQSLGKNLGKTLVVTKRLPLLALSISAVLLASGVAQAQTAGNDKTDAGNSVMEAAAGDAVDTSNMTVEELEAFVEKQRAELEAAIAERDKHAEQLKEIMSASEDNEASAAEKAEKLKALCEEHGAMFQEKIDADPSFASNPDYQKYSDACGGV